MKTQKDIILDILIENKDKELTIKDIMDILEKNKIKIGNKTPENSVISILYKLISQSIVEKVDKKYILVEKENYNTPNTEENQSNSQKTRESYESSQKYKKEILANEENIFSEMLFVRSKYLKKKVRVQFKSNFNLIGFEPGTLWNYSD